MAERRIRMPSYSGLGTAPGGRDALQRAASSAGCTGSRWGGWFAIRKAPSSTRARLKCSPLAPYACWSPLAPIPICRARMQMLRWSIQYMVHGLADNKSVTG
ncbi:hypothetical protein KCP76_18665 [Salmonella enterica subsp. enterica serovar Weltevreden]|nr:hypothetical protein KCP76_18665 [Salmonella enterica subsp. enterica serovar Weltevreden]